MSDVSVSVAAELEAIVRPVFWQTGTVSVTVGLTAMDADIAHTCEHMRQAAEPVEVIAAVRSMYKRLGIDPTKTRPSSEALLRRVRRGDPLPRINSLVDVINWTSLETQLSFGLYDADRIEGPVVLRRGLAGEEYAGIRKDVVHVSDRMVLADDRGAFGNPTSDSARTMVTVDTRRALVVIYAPTQVGAEVGRRAKELTALRIDRFCRTVE